MKKINLIFLMLFTIVLSLSAVVITPTGGDDASKIQQALDNLESGDILELNGDFIIKKTIFLPSNITFKLNGKLTLGTNPELFDVGWEDVINGVNINATRYTAITEKNWNTTGSSNIKMIGGFYDGNKVEYIKQDGDSSRVRFINFVRVTNSEFRDFVVKNASDDNFTLGPGCSGNECYNILSSHAGREPGKESGNALTDKGSYNKWFDCIAEECTSDGWTPKSRYSEYYRCIGRSNVGPGWGCYARLDGSPASNSIGDSIIGNKFIECEAYDNERGGFSFNIPTNSGPGSVVSDNYIQILSYNNEMNGIKFRNKSPDGVVNNNEIHLIAYGNNGSNNSGGTSSYAGGIGIEAGYPITNIHGSVLCYDNTRYDVNLERATNCDIIVYQPTSESNTVVGYSSYTNKINRVNFSCGDSLESWTQKQYCDVIYTSINSTEINPISIYPNPLNQDLLSIDLTELVNKNNVEVNIYDILGKQIYNEKINNQDYLQINTGNLLNSNIYFITIQSNEFISTNKLLVK